MHGANLFTAGGQTARWRGAENGSAAPKKKCAKPLERFFPLHHLVFRRKNPGSEARGEAGAFTIMLLKGGYGYEV
jgi:hypothetical protein